ncbi:MAG: hypothetical protein A3K19_12590 [Lentisphaerae bacterium RIFOXYB12_FULL_65_16]|nr:MAG: hypothetical protein A3K18_12085 [Lentisphaerae bacterium RIFOXYA12_64_32]OGV88121.1 MAG: hypothetical protein A3K19_12590 [Lentisphaerae bacterium RIFOXYB12_FULL_65_16]
MLPAQPNLSLINGLACLQMVVMADAPIGSREVARRLGLEPTRVNRLLGTLAHLGLVEKTTNRKYRPGPGLHVLSAQSLRGSGLLPVALPHLRPFAAERVTVAMAVLWQRHVCYLIHAAPGHRPEEGIAGHGLYATHESIMGVSLLADKSDAEIRELYVDGAQPALSNEAFATLMDEVRAARQQGYSFRHDPTGKVAFAFNVGEPAVAAISLTGQITEPRIPALIERLRAAARAITAELRHG